MLMMLATMLLIMMMLVMILLLMTYWRQRHTRKTKPFSNVSESRPPKLQTHSNLKEQPKEPSKEPCKEPVTSRNKFGHDESCEKLTRQLISFFISTTQTGKTLCNVISPQTTTDHTQIRSTWLRFHDLCCML